jgi:hypothetical protein
MTDNWNYEAWIEWEIALFYRRWSGCRHRGLARLIWWAWPIRWKFITKQRGMWGLKTTNYCLTANEAAIEFAKWYSEATERIEDQ